MANRNPRTRKPGKGAAPKAKRAVKKRAVVKSGRAPGRPRKVRAEAGRSGILKNLNYPRLERELQKLADLLKSVQNKNQIVRQSLSYLEREQKAVAQQFQEARRYLHQLKQRGMRAIGHIPENTEEFVQQLKQGLRQLSKRVGL